MYTSIPGPKRSFSATSMMKIFSVLFFVLLFSAGCKDTKGRMTDFVDAYNRDAAFSTNQFVSSTSAKADYRDRIIKIRVVTTYSANDPENAFIKQVMPNMMTEVLKTQPLSNKLIEAGVKFEVTYFTERLSEISVVTIDKKKLEELNKSTPAALNNEPSFINPKPKAPSSQFDQILAMLNKSLPYTDQSSGITIFRIDQNRMGDLVYHVRAPKDLEAPIKTKAGVELMKGEILRDGKLEKLMNEFSRFQLSGIKYIYYDGKGNQLNELRITSADFN